MLSIIELIVAFHPLLCDSWLFSLNPKRLKNFKFLLNLKRLKNFKSLFFQCVVNFFCQPSYQHRIPPGQALLYSVPVFETTTLLGTKELISYLMPSHRRSSSSGSQLMKELCLVDSKHGYRARGISTLNWMLSMIIMSDSYDVMILEKWVKTVSCLSPYHWSG